MSVCPVEWNISSLTGKIVVKFLYLESFTKLSTRFDFFVKLVKMAQETLYIKTYVQFGTSLLLTYLLTYSMEQSPSWEADQFSQLTKQFPAFYGTRRFFTLLTSVRHLSLSWANSIQSPLSPPTFWTSILILSSHLRLGLPNGLFP
jgi:hypothetical protein